MSSFKHHQSQRYFDFSFFSKHVDLGIWSSASITTECCPGVGFFVEILNIIWFRIKKPSKFQIQKILSKKCLMVPPLLFFKKPPFKIKDFLGVYGEHLSLDHAWFENAACKVVLRIMEEKTNMVQS